MIRKLLISSFLLAGCGTTDVTSTIDSDDVYCVPYEVYYLWCTLKPTPPENGK